MRVRTCLGGIAGALLLAGTAGAQDKIEIRFGTTNPPGGMQYLSGEEWVKRVNEKPGDLVQADIYGSSQLGDDTEMLQKVRLGTLEVSQPSTIMSTVLPKFSLFDMPYLVKDRAHMDCIAKLAWPSSPGLPRLGPAIQSGAGAFAVDAWIKSRHDKTRTSLLLDARINSDQARA
jgi:TRAP-type transport system periplasmic protein